MAIKTEPKLRKADRLVGQKLTELREAYVLPEGMEWPPKPGGITYCDKAALTAMKPGRPHSGKDVVSLRLDPDIIKAFRATGKGWQARMNDALRKAMP